MDLLLGSAQGSRNSADFRVQETVDSNSRLKARLTRRLLKAEAVFEAPLEDVAAGRTGGRRKPQEAYAKGYGVCLEASFSPR